jgi:tetratricopeptide (TPR) repeat protein
MKYPCFCVFWCFFAIIPAISGFGQENFSKGEELFMQNKPQEAVIHLENAVAEDPAHVQAFLYLGIAYEQLGRIDEAIAAYRQVLDRAGDLTARVASNLGNVYFRKGEAENAEQYYSRSIEADPRYAAAWLGRANTRIQAGDPGTAVADYEQYLAVAPNAPQRPQIERLVSVIRTEVAAEERRRVLAEEQARAEAERKQRLQDEVTASLQSAAEASQGLSSGTEEIESYTGEFELE